MYRTGVARLPLHYGKAPRWLTIRMCRLTKEIATIIVEDYGVDEFVKRLADPFWFQALGCVLGYDWHSSGVTTVVTKVLKDAIAPEEVGIAICGGKGKRSLQAPFEIQEYGEKFGFSDDKIRSLVYASKMSAKVDNAAIQAGYQLYHHAFIVNEKGTWTVIQQGMCLQDHTARRYHWLSDDIKDFVVEPHSAIVGDAKREVALDMTAKESENCRKISVDVAKEKPEKTMAMFEPVKPAFQSSLKDWMPTVAYKAQRIKCLTMPVKINWKAMEEVYNFQPNNYEQLLAFKGVGPATVRGLALIAELVYGEKPSWRDPVKYSFAYGGKDGVPYPVNRKAMDDSVEILREAVADAKLGEKEKLQSIRRLMQFVPKDDQTSEKKP